MRSRRPTTDRPRGSPSDPVGTTGMVELSDPDVDHVVVVRRPPNGDVQLIDEALLTQAHDLLEGLSQERLQETASDRYVPIARLDLVQPALEKLLD